MARPVLCRPVERRLLDLAWQDE